MWRRLSYFPRALKVRWTFAQRGPKWNGLVDSRKVNVDFSLENFNLPKSENARQQQCTPEKEEA